MFDIGFLELLVISIVGLLVLGPERLPKAARTAGLWLGKIKRTVSGMQREINSQLEAEELRQKLKEQQAKLDESLNKAKRDVESIAESPTAKTASHTERDRPAASSDENRPLPSPATRLDAALSNARAVNNDSSDNDKDAASR